MRKKKPEQIFVIHGKWVQIVSKKQYLLDKIKQPIIYILSPIMFVVCVACIVLGIVCIGVILYFRYFHALALYLILALIAGAVVSGFINSSANNAMHSGYSVEPITEQNAHFLPAQDTLLRGSDLPPTVQQSELLRATQAAQETPQEELLRATTAEE